MPGFKKAPARASPCQVDLNFAISPGAILFTIACAVHISVAGPTIVPAASRTAKWLGHEVTAKLTVSSELFVTVTVTSTASPALNLASDVATSTVSCAGPVSSEQPVNKSETSAAMLKKFLIVSPGYFNVPRDGPWGAMS